MRVNPTLDTLNSHPRKPSLLPDGNKPRGGAHSLRFTDTLFQLVSPLEVSSNHFVGHRVSASSPMAPKANGNGNGKGKSGRGATQKRNAKRRSQRRAGSQRDPIQAVSTAGRSLIQDFTSGNKAGSITGCVFSATSRVLPATKGAYSGTAAPHFFLHLLAWLRNAISKSKLGPFLDGAMEQVVSHAGQLWGAILILTAILLSRFQKRDGLAIWGFIVPLFLPEQNAWAYAAIAFAIYLFSLQIWLPYRLLACAGFVLYAFVFAPAAPAAWSYAAPTSFWGTT